MLKLLWSLEPLASSAHSPLALGQHLSSPIGPGVRACLCSLNPAFYDFLWSEWHNKSVQNKNNLHKKYANMQTSLDFDKYTIFIQGPHISYALWVGRIILAASVPNLAFTLFGFYFYFRFGIRTWSYQHKTFLRDSHLTHSHPVRWAEIVNVIFYKSCMPMANFKWNLRALEELYEIMEVFILFVSTLIIIQHWHLFTVYNNIQI